MRNRKQHRLWMRYYRRTLRGFLDQKYTAMSRRIRGKDKNCVSTVKGLSIIPRQLFLSWAYQQPELEILFKQYKKANWNFKLCPTIDRINTTKGYEFGNMRFITQSENAKGAALNRPKTYRSSRDYKIWYLREWRKTNGHV